MESFHTAYYLIDHVTDWYTVCTAEDNYWLSAVNGSRFGCFRCRDNNLGTKSMEVISSSSAHQGPAQNQCTSYHKAITCSMKEYCLEVHRSWTGFNDWCLLNLSSNIVELPRHTTALWSRSTELCWRQTLKLGKLGPEYQILFNCLLAAWIKG